MVRAKHGVLVSLENGDGGDTMPNAFARLVEETPYNFRNDATLASADSCVPNRGSSDGEIFQFNHWVTPANPAGGAHASTPAGCWTARIRQCTTTRGRGPTLVAVDFAERGDLLPVVDAARPRRAVELKLRYSRMPFIARSVSRLASRSASAWRLSYARLPRASASSTLARPSLK